MHCLRYLSRIATSFAPAQALPAITDHRPRTTDHGPPGPVVSSPIIPWSFLLASLFLTPPSSAQETIRMITASEAAARAHQKAASDPSYYNLKLGPTFWTVTGGLGIEFTDNPSFQVGKKELDLIVRPDLR